MKNLKTSLFLLIMLLSSLFFTGCWNYKEIDEIAVVAGVAIDKGTNEKYKVTVETVKITGGKEVSTTSKLLSMEGKTLFDAVRNIISISGEKLYWSHSKVIILSKQIASEGVVKVTDWFNRDAETRPDVHLLISEEKTAKEIFDVQHEDEIISFTLDSILTSQASLSKAPNTDVFQFDNDLIAKGISPTSPTIKIKKVNGNLMPFIEGTAIFKRDKLIGFLNAEDTKVMLFVKNKIKGGVLPLVSVDNDLTTPVSLEIFKSKTKVMPIVNGTDIKIDIHIDSTVAIDEIEGIEDYIAENGRKKLEQSVENMLKERVNELIKKVQVKYSTDIFGFGAVLNRDQNKEWKQVSNHWDEFFKDLPVNVTAKINIRNSAMLSKPLEVGE